MHNCFQVNKSSEADMLAQDKIMLHDEPPGEESDPGSNPGRRILVVMDALKEFSIDLLEWALKNFTLGDHGQIKVLGIRPWLNFTLSSKTWSNIWSLNLEDLSSFLDNIDQFKNEVKYDKVQRLVGLCQKYNVVPEIKTEMGYPLQLRVAEQIGSLHATLVIFDRHHDKKYIDYYAEKLPCNMLVMNDNGEVDLVQKRKCCDCVCHHVEDKAMDNEADVESSPTTMRPCTSTSILSHHFKNFLKPKF